MNDYIFFPHILALVDPGRITIPLCDDPDVLGHGAQYGNSFLPYQFS